MKSPIGLFEAYGIEIELMIVDQEGLNIQPWSDRLLKEAAGKQVSDFEDGPITWSNELVSHVIEFKTTGPSATLEDLEAKFYASQRHASDILKKFGARLMPTGMHPWMDPLTETHLWPHDNNEIYSLYNKIFDCRGHGWSNLQSVHINLPFKSETEFDRLHSAIRVVLPLIPALSASTPFADAKLSGVKDTRLAFYETNQRQLPIIAGDIIPVPVKGFADYREKITDPIRTAIQPFDSAGLLEGDWLNSRGAIARIDRGTIEIRLIDTQECAKADLAIVQLIVALIRSLVSDSDFLSHADAVPTDSLHRIYKSCVQSAESAIITDATYLKLFSAKESRAQDLWSHLTDRYVLGKNIGDSQAGASSEFSRMIEGLLSHPSLATRIQTAAGSNPRPEKLKIIYSQLCECLDQNKIFEAVNI